MSEVKTYRCDWCKKLRVEDSNHWFKGYFSENGVLVAPLSSTCPAHDPDVHLCGIECSQKWLLSKLSELTQR